MTYTLKWNQDRVITRARRTMLQRGEMAAAALEAQVKQRISTPYPPASLPGQPPHRRSGRLLAGVRGLAKLLGTRIRITVGAAARYAPFLQRGTSRMAPRPFVGYSEDQILVRNILRRGRRGK